MDHLNDVAAARRFVCLIPGLILLEHSSAVVSDGVDVQWLASLWHAILFQLTILIFEYLRQGSS